MWPTSSFTAQSSNAPSAGQKQQQTPLALANLPLCARLSARCLSAAADFPLHAFAHAFTTLSWSLVARADDVRAIAFADIDWTGDRLAIRARPSTTKYASASSALPASSSSSSPASSSSSSSSASAFSSSPVSGAGGALPKSVYANPSKPDLCPILALAIHVFSRSDLCASANDKGTAASSSSSSASPSSSSSSSSSFPSSSALPLLFPNTVTDVVLAQWLRQSASASDMPIGMAQMLRVLAFTKHTQSYIDRIVRSDESCCLKLLFFCIIRMHEPC
jgi:hypothetical protein